MNYRIKMSKWEIVGIVVIVIAVILAIVGMVIKCQVLAAIGAVLAMAVWSTYIFS